MHSRGYTKILIYRYTLWVTIYTSVHTLLYINKIKQWAVIFPEQCISLPLGPPLHPHFEYSGRPRCTPPTPWHEMTSPLSQTHQRLSVKVKMRATSKYWIAIVTNE